LEGSAGLVAANPNEEFSPLSIARRYWLSVSGTLVFLFVENIVAVLEPYLLGRAIDGLIGKSYFDLWIFVGVATFGLTVGVARRRYDTRVYGRIFSDTASDVVARENDKGAPVAQVTARANFVNDVTQFYEVYLPAAIVSFVSLFGAILMLAFVAPALSVGAFVVAMAVCAIFFVSRKRIDALNKGVNDEMERQVGVLVGRDLAGARAHFASLVSWRVQLSDLEACNFGLTQFATILLMAGAILVLVMWQEQTVGEVFAALTYVLQFTQAVIVLPYTYQQYLRTSEIGTRLGE
jgi:ABC-type bacteriocin/lantibiotic exporter with double-glycine peptidase domain